MLPLKAISRNPNADEVCPATRSPVPQEAAVAARTRFPCVSASAARVLHQHNLVSSASILGASPGLVGHAAQA